MLILVFFYSKNIPRENSNFLFNFGKAIEKPNSVLVKKYTITLRFYRWKITIEIIMCL